VLSQVLMARADKPGRVAAFEFLVVTPAISNLIREDRTWQINSVIQISSTIVTQENKGDKMGMLYDYLTSNEFRMQIEAMVEGFTQMKSDLEAEQRSMRGIWKKREKQIEKVLLNTTGMYGSIRGIAGNAVQAVPLLELPDEDAI